MSQERFYVYVIQLATDPRKPHLPGRPDLYVGSSALTPHERFEHHRAHKHGSRYVKRRGLRLRPDLYARLNSFRTREQSKRAERALATQLRQRGHRVYGACSPVRSTTCVM